MRLALIPPDSLAEMMRWTDLHLLLPEQLDRLPARFVHSLKGYRILDNGVAEGVHVPMNALLNYVDAYEINELVLPDELEECDQTIANARSYVHLKNQRPHIKLMGVAQGRTISEVLKCIRALSYMDHVDVIGLPRVWLSTFDSEMRIRMARLIDQGVECTRKPVHCLGANPVFPQEPMFLVHIPVVRSMDTSLPFVYGMKRTHLPSDKDLWRPAGYFEADVISDYQRGVIEDNVRLYIRWTQAPAGAL